MIVSFSVVKCNSMRVSATIAMNKLQTWRVWNFTDGFDLFSISKI